ncbi:hypothetical protein IAD21_02860 [Abditibacteriota bacterium]|nr:hypothetical protein IAD21_02860 [Abditibacteriota bacterium]
MLVHHPGSRNYLLTALDATPNLCTALLHGLMEEEADFSPDPARFSIREVMAHLADWDQIFLARIKLTIKEETPPLKEFDEGQRALDFDYAHSDVWKELRLFHEHRPHVTEFLRALSTDEWERICFHPRIGHMSVEALATLVALHDTYHLSQIAQWRQTYAVYQSVLD